jgi:Asp-tRNA(Asn)/Glu-tRNA(Gln) amidotransferase A subunit family amidase
MSGAGGPPGSALWKRDAWALADAVRAGEVRAAAVLDVHLDRIARLDPELNAVCFLDADAARTRAGAIDAAVARGEDPGPLAGVPIGVKELASVRGWPETHASVVYADAVATTDDTEVARLRAAGAVLTGLTTASEQGTVSFTNTPLHGITRNPWDPARTPGGSSGGSAAAVAAGLFPVCTGGDGGGSIRIPASYCGLFGMKSTFGLVGSGPGAFDMSLNSVRGPMARSVRDAARYLDVVAGPTPTDPTSLPRPAVSFETEIVSGAAQERLRGLRAAFVDSVGFAGARSDVATVARDAASALVDAAGFELVEVEIELPKPGASWGVLSSINDMAWHLDAVRDHLDELTRAPAPRRAVEGRPAPPRAAGRARRGLRRGRRPAHADHPDARLRGRGPPPGRGRGSRGLAVRAVGGVHRTVQPERPARRQHAGRDRRRAARRPPGRRPPPPRPAAPRGRCGARGGAAVAPPGA